MDQLTIQKYGQITIPTSMLAYFNLHEGDTLFLSIEAEGMHLVPKRKKSIMELEGLLSRPQKTLTVEEMNQVIREQ